jgi:hypothetical protein
MRQFVARGAGVLAVLAGSAALTIDVLAWVGVGPRVRRVQRAPLIAGAAILTLVWAADAVVRPERKPPARMMVRQRAAARDTETKTDSAEQATAAAFTKALNLARWEGYGQCLSDIGMDGTVVPMRRNHRGD